MSEMTIRYSAASDRGQREGNQDNLRIGDRFRLADLDTRFESVGAWETEGFQVLCVCDGIGGAYMGDLATVLALESVDAVCTAPDALKYGLKQLAYDAAEAAQLAVCRFYQEAGRPGGCTITLAAVSEDAFVCLNIGDSPCFLWREQTRELRELSVRHNLYWHKRRMDLEPEPRDASTLMRYLGKQNCTAALMADCVSGTMEPGDRMLLCSDGVTGAFSMEELTAAMAAGADAAQLVKKAAAVPGADNCTAIIFSIDHNNGN